MAVDFDVLELLTQSATLRTTTGVNRAGEQQYSGSGTAYVCRIEGSSKQFRSPTGRDIVGVRKIIFGQVVTMTTNDELTLPDGTKPPIVEVETVPDETGNYYTIAYVGSSTSVAQRA